MIKPDHFRKSQTGKPIEPANFILLSVESLEILIEKIFRRVLSEKEEKPTEAYLTTEEVCRHFHVSRVTLHAYAKSGRLLPYSKAGKQHTYLKSECVKAFHKNPD